ncbi:energy transducer TonB [Gammaproteobacteria bacterium]|nr:energy transducer TonB [Gammaproteobacteria bacterium]
MAADQLSKYIIISIVIHAIFLISLKSAYINRDISQIGEQGMQIQMVLIQDKVNDIQEDESILSEEKKILKENEQEQQAVFDNRLQGDKAKKIYQSYYGVIRNILDSNKKYPLLSLQRRQEGTPVVEFTILKNGTITNLTVSSSGFRLLDREAQKIVLKSSPLPPIPDSLGKSSIDLRIPINFNLQR